jgi:hypothetical protein
VADGDGGLGVAVRRIQAGIRQFAGLPLSLRLAGIAAAAVIAGTLAPMEVEHEQFAINTWYAAVDGNVGQLVLLAGLASIFQTYRLARSRRSVDSGGIAALGLLAVVLAAIQMIRIHDSSSVSIGWGLYVVAAAAVALLLSGVLLLGGEHETLPPPD